jgi:hypothetical protein
MSPARRWLIWGIDQGTPDRDAAARGGVEGLRSRCYHGPHDRQHHGPYDLGDSDESVVEIVDCGRSADACGFEGSRK